MIRQAFTGKTTAKKLAILLAIGTALLLCLLVIEQYTLDLVSYVVCRAFLQKAPPGIEAHEVQEAFARAIAAVHGKSEERRRLLQKLFEISQRLEKIQRLSEKEAEEVLSQLKN